ncbi:MAG TPA: hypothetical protein VKH42_02320 [Vicinamibacterales bacterium]|nr:hypothetical protein [Vicinamibacterales bacterium]
MAKDTKETKDTKDAKDTKDTKDTAGDRRLALPAVTLTEKAAATQTIFAATVCDCAGFFRQGGPLRGPVARSVSACSAVSAFERLLFRVFRVFVCFVVRPTIDVG